MSNRPLGVAMLLAASAGIGAGSAAGAPLAGPPSVIASSVTVPTQFNKLFSSGSNLMISSYDPSCVAQLVNTSTLSLQRGTHACLPVVNGTSVGIGFGKGKSVAAYWNCQPESGEVYAISYNSATRKGNDGPVLMRFGGACSHQYPVWSYGGGSLWVSDSSTGPRANQGELLQLSATTGTLENSVTLPSMPAGVFAANDDGFFIGPGEFYKNGQEIYRVSPGASHAQLLRQVPGPMSWMYGFTHMMFAQVRFDYAAPCERGACHLWRFVGAAAAATIMNSSVPSAEQQPVGNANVGILAIEPSTSAPYPRAVVEIRIDPENGTKTILARLSVSKDQFVESSAYLAGSLYVLVEGRLFRVPVRPLYR